MGKANFGTVEIARMLRVHQTTVAKWIDAGRLPCYRSVGRHRRVTRAALLDFLREQNIPLPLELQGFGGQFMLLCAGTSAVQPIMQTIRRIHPEADVVLLHDRLDALIRLGRIRPDVMLLALDWTVPENRKICRACLDMSFDPPTRIWVCGDAGALAMLPVGTRFPDFTFTLPRDKPQLESQLRSL